MNISTSTVLSTFIVLVSAAKVFFEHRNDEIPIRWWILHIGLCLLFGSPIPIQGDVLILIFFAIFGIVLLDAKAEYSLPVLQILMLVGFGFLVFFYIGWQKITSSPNGLLVFVLTYLLSFFPQIYVGIMFFLDLKDKKFPALDIALVLTADYFLCLTTSGVISKIF